MNEKKCVNCKHLEICAVMYKLDKFVDRVAIKMQSSGNNLNLSEKINEVHNLINLAPACEHFTE